MRYTIPLSPVCLDWVAKQPEEDQALLGWTLTNRGVPRHPGGTNYDLTPKDLHDGLVYHWGVNYHRRAEMLSWHDEYEFVPAYPLWATTLLTIFHKALPYILAFLLGLACGLDF